MRECTRYDNLQAASPYSIRYQEPYHPSWSRAWSSVVHAAKLAPMTLLHLARHVFPSGLPRQTRVALHTSAAQPSGGALSLQ